jgi:hypothetical protein
VFRVGCDIGDTFTDVVLLDERTGQVFIERLGYPFDEQTIPKTNNYYDPRRSRLAEPGAVSQKQIDGYVWFNTQGLALETRGTPVHVLDIDQFVPLPQDLMLSTERTIKTRAAALRA